MLDKRGQGGLFSSLRRLLDTTLEITQVRLELLGTEVEIEKRRVLDGVLWGAVALLCLGVGITLFCALVVLMLWDGYRVAAVGALTVVFTGLGALLLHQARIRLRNERRLFDASLDELARDRAALQSHDQHEPR